MNSRLGPGETSLPQEHGAAQAWRCSPRPSRSLTDSQVALLANITQLLYMEGRHLVTVSFLYWVCLMAVVRQSGWALASLLHSSSIKQREKRGTHCSVSQGAEDKHIKLCHAVRCCVCAGTCKITSLESQPLLWSKQQDKSDYISPFASFRNGLLQAGEGGRKHHSSIFSAERNRAPAMNYKCRLGCICLPAIAVRTAATVHPRAQACKCKFLQGLKDVIKIRNHISHLTICGTMMSFLSFQKSITHKYHKRLFIFS